MFDKSKVLSVGELNFAVKQLVENNIPLLWVRGEISNFVRAASGHWYFSLKDEQAQVRCVMFRHKNQLIDWQPKNGSQVEVLALATLYEARGDFQLTLEQMRPAGLGALFEAFEKLKTKLDAEGLFEAVRKKPLPAMPQQIGIITSPQAAALRDVLTTLRKRMPSIPVVLYPTPVQGAEAAQKIAAALATANQRKECDVLILCRGGGSIEDLWSFNEEVVARAVAASEIPVVSGVGHETDFTIADFVADLRAATPTAAAQAVVPDRNEFLQRLQYQQQHLRRAMMRPLETAMQRLDFLARRLVHPAQHMEQQSQYLQQLQQRLRGILAMHMQQRDWKWQSLQHRLHARKPSVQPHITHLDGLERRMDGAMLHLLEKQLHRLQAVHQQLQLLDPMQVLSRGYSLVRDENGTVVTDSAGLMAGDQLEVTFAKGGAEVAVKTVK